MTRFTLTHRWTMMSALAVFLWGGPGFAQAPVELPAPLVVPGRGPTRLAYDEPVAPVAGPSDIAGCDKGCAGNGCDCGSDGCECGGGFLCHELSDPWTLASVFGDEPPLTIGGWFQFGYTNKSDGVFNTHPNRFNLHQGWLYLERVADGSKGVDFGGRVDLVYGVDAQNTQAFGNNPGRFDFANGWDNGIYGWALPQVYGEVAWGDVSVKVGHFFTLLGYHVVPATGNFFYSHPFTMNFSEAFTHTGALATYKANDEVTVYGGWTLGWDTGFDRFDNGSNFLGGTSVNVAEGLTVTYITTVGDLGWIGEGYTHSLVADWVIDDKWEYVFQSDLTETNFHPNTATGFHSVSLANFLYYTICDPLRVGGRFEWWKANGVSYYEATAGLNYKPMANLVIRPELRYQWAPGATDANPWGIPVNQGIFGIDAIVTY